MPTIELKFKVGGTLTNATSVVLSDPTSAFGVKRDDTDAAVVADGTAMTNAATGVYRHTFTAPAAGLTYTWYAEVVYAGATYYFERVFTDAGELDVFGTRAGIERKVGVNNLKIYTALDSDDPFATTEPPEIATNIADDLEEAATDMHSAWREYLESVTGDGEDVPAVALGYSNAVEQRWLADTNEYGAAVKAWVGRTIDAPQGQDVPQQIGTAMDEWAKRLEWLRTGKALLAYQTDEGVIDETADEPGGFEMVTLERTPECDEDEYAR